MLTNATIRRIDKQTGTDATTGVPTYTNGPDVAIRCAVAKSGEVFGDNSTEKQVLTPNLGRCFVPLKSLSEGQIARTDRIVIEPDTRQPRTFIANLTWEHGLGSALGHMEIDLRDA